MVGRNSPSEHHIFFFWSIDSQLFDIPVTHLKRLVIHYTYPMISPEDVSRIFLIKPPQTLVVDNYIWRSGQMT